MFVDVASWRVKEAMRRAGKALLEDFAVRPAPVPEPLPPVPDDPVEEPVGAGVVWCGRVARSADLQRFVDHLTAVRAAAQTQSR